MSTKKTTKRVSIIPRGKCVLVLVDEEQSRTSEFGVIVPDEVEQERKSQGTVEAVGDIDDLSKGDRVIYGTYLGETIKLRGSDGKQVEYKLLDSDHIIAFIRQLNTK